MPYPLDIIPVSGGGPHPLLILVIALWLVYALSLLAPGTVDLLRSARRAWRTVTFWLLLCLFLVCTKVAATKPPETPEPRDRRLIRLYYHEQAKRYISIDSVIREQWNAK
jgi:hypothetical protein